MKASMKSFWKDRIFVWLFALTLIIFPYHGNPPIPITSLAKLEFFSLKYLLPYIFGVLLFEFIYRLTRGKVRT